MIAGVNAGFICVSIGWKNFVKIFERTCKKRTTEINILMWKIYFRYYDNCAIIQTDYAFFVPMIKTTGFELYFDCFFFRI